MCTLHLLILLVAHARDWQAHELENLWNAQAQGPPQGFCALLLLPRAQAQVAAFLPLCWLCPARSGAAGEGRGQQHGNSVATGSTEEIEPATRTAVQRAPEVKSGANGSEEDSIPLSEKKQTLIGEICI